MDPARKIPENFLDGFRDRDCASMDCQTCGYCELIATQAVSIAPEYRAEQSSVKGWPASAAGNRFPLSGSRCYFRSFFM